MLDEHDESLKDYSFDFAHIRHVCYITSNVDNEFAIFLSVYRFIRTDYYCCWIIIFVDLGLSGIGAI